MILVSLSQTSSRCNFEARFSLGVVVHDMCTFYILKVGRYVIRHNNVVLCTKIAKKIKSIIIIIL